MATKRATPKSNKATAKQPVAKPRATTIKRKLLLAGVSEVLLKKLPKTPTNSRQRKEMLRLKTLDEVAKQHAAEIANPELRKKRKKLEDIEIAKHLALKERVPREAFVQSFADQICERVSNGEDLGYVLKELNIKFVDMCAWMRRNAEFAAGFSVARENAAHLYVSQIIAIADGAEGKAEVERLQIQTRQWMATKLLSKLYGDKIVHAGDAHNPVVTKLVADADELEAKLRGVK